MMYPIIHRPREPLVPADPPSGADVSPASSPSTPAPAEPALPPKTENRSDFGQFRSDSVPGSQPPGASKQPEGRPNLNSQPPSSNQPNEPVAPERHENRSDFGQFRSDSVPNPQPLWSFQPNEPAADYQLFVAWLQLPPPRHFRKAAVALGCSQHRLRQLSARHNWKARAAAFDHHRASAASLALDQLLRDETLNWKERAERFRLQEWLLHEEMLQLARDTVRRLHKHPSRVSVNDYVKLCQLASALGRRACGLPLDPAASAKPEPPFCQSDVEAALLKIYGPDDPPAASPDETAGAAIKQKS